MPAYHERLWPSVWLFVATALVIPASILVLAPISLIAGVITAVVLYAGCVVGLLLAAPTVEVEDGTLHAAKASIATSLVGEVTSFSGDEAFKERGQRLDARAWLMLRPWVDPIVKVPVLDASDPAPYWIVSTRHPKELAAAINSSRRPVSGEN